MGSLALLFPPWGCKYLLHFQSLIQQLHQGPHAVRFILCICQALTEPPRRQPYQALSGSCQQALPSILNSIWVWRLYMGWILQVGQSLHGLSFSLCSTFYLPVCSSAYFVLLLRRTEASTLWSSFLLSFIWSVSCIVGIPSFCSIIHLSVSTYHLCSFVTNLPHSG